MADIHVQEHSATGRDSYDVVVIGASFAGLSFASAAAAHGMRVLVLERDQSVGGVVRTTGILFSDVLDIMDVPSRFLLNAVRHIRMYLPDSEPLDVGSRAYRFYMADVTGMLQWMADGAIDHGATVRCGATFMDAIRDGGDIMKITYSSANATTSSPQTVYGRFLIGADGAHSQVARKLGLQQNTAFLAGAEWLVDGLTLAPDTFLLVMNHTLAPGYCMWLAPHNTIAALGVAGHQREFKPNESLKAAQAIFGEYVDTTHLRIVQRKGGVIPVGGRLRDVYRDDAKGRALLLGDAAGLCGAATGGGIYPALLCGRLAAHAVANEVLNGSKGAVRTYLRDLPHAGRLGRYLRVEDVLRHALDRVTSDADVSAFYGLFATKAGNTVLRKALFETPIISMDSGFAAMIRTLLLSSPATYGAAVRAVWQKLIPRKAGA